ncbi:MarR family winged helix-turn-helix transcriptional regulator [Hoeflea ulvae]|uniref:MarR family winged helix-turn-helix transcriptional regulator n=1 Tax=Hoeflea ulvae TaxID=2983764 RepID=A0ABT3YMD2_9HYPH|nr:MarR family winged helix-turn-helix transcriptional regulator [Hoeflea ulvae]MCY0096987.1 MarR family winged helix-turn-helix transcriptional regulator [Hoeflea ulvae]
MTDDTGTTEALKTVDFSLEVHNAHLIRRAHQRATVMFQQMLGSHKLTPTQLAVLGTLDRSPDLPQNELSRRTAIDTATLSSMLRRLEAAGLIERVPSSPDQRVQLVRLSDQGREVTRPMIPISMQLSAALLDPVPAAERARFVELLTLVGADPDSAPQTKDKTK